MLSLRVLHCSVCKVPLNLAMLYGTVVLVSNCEQVSRHQAHRTLCWLAWVGEWCSFFLWGCCAWVGYYTEWPHMCSGKQLSLLCCLPASWLAVHGCFLRKILHFMWMLLRSVTCSNFQEWSSTSHSIALAICASQEVLLGLFWQASIFWFLPSSHCFTLNISRVPFILDVHSMLCRNMWNSFVS